MKPFGAYVKVSCFSDTAFICGSTGAIGVQIDASVQQMWCIMLHHSTEKWQKMSVFGPPC